MIRCRVLVNAHSCLTIHCEFFIPQLLVCFHTWVFSLRNFYVLFSESKRKQKDINRIQAGRMKTKLRIALEKLVKLKPLRQEIAVLKLEKIQSSSKLRSLKSFCWLKVLCFFLA